MARKSIAVILAAAGCLVVSGCSSWFKDKDDSLPRVSLPAKPASQSVPCEDLTAQQEAVCLQEPNAQARDVCRKVQRNKLVCDDVKRHVDDLYESRDAS